MDFREDQLVKTSTNRLGRSIILTPDQTLRAIGRMPFAKHSGPNDRNLKLYLRHLDVLGAAAASRARVTTLGGWYQTYSSEPIHRRAEVDSETHLTRRSPSKRHSPGSTQRLLR